MCIYSVLSLHLNRSLRVFSRVQVSEEQQEHSPPRATEETEKETIFDTVAQVTPEGCTVLPRCPVLDRSLTHSLIALRWSTGWECGTVQALLDPSRKRGRGFEEGANFHVKFPADVSVREATLSADRYSRAKTAPVGSWVRFKQE